MNTHGNTVFLPGGTRGIGLALATRLQARGNTVVVGGRDTAVLDALAAEHGFGTVRIDTSDPASITSASAEVIERFPDVNVLVPMAGIMRAEDWRGPGFLADAEAVVTTNLLGPIRLIAAFTEHLQSRPDATILTVSSGLAFAPLGVTPSYNASKAAVHMLSESLRLQLAGTSVSVVELVPPSVQTELMPGQDTNPLAMPLDEFADEALSLLENKPGAHEVQVERVKFLRYGEARGDYADVVAALNATDPHAAAH
ncbi:SDR family NAD(P)-dependent oxidoreductase [Promicromonospora sukumoe]|uniref:Short-subunit dehydrogenase involved in D-alanine esterification of teichoic acids n=1 Tax=Promicromonospora sukumoe TaxID=88382 RepID=A0A7W3J6X5_9MICO|nr:SDR family NAD(P)-dependent oxidoreductase [Promicromonospora sukumoe]MBA8807408.1 short-subunit dehydrogenase involved in D-alanine esterification of teichoic acids [Promicromonospora sukumoe]